jgi:asparagine synthase (glutamine-hydrolysing)
MARLGSEPVRTFTVGFDYEHDELSQAAQVAGLLGCDHTEIECKPSDIELLPQIVYHLDEPIGDAIVVPMYQLAREAKKRVTVILAGEGADELLGGYLFHRALLWGYWLGRALPHAMRRGLLMPMLRATPAAVINLAFSYPATLGRRGKQKVLDFLSLLDPDQLPAAYRHLISLFDARDTEELFTPEFEVLRADSGSAAEADPRLDPDAPYLNRILDLQFAHWLPDDILMKQDKLSMAHGVEARVPFLDHELVEYALRLPPSLKIRGIASKAVLRRYAAGVLPRAVSSRRKMPFYVPVEKYLAQPAFRDIVDDTLSESSVRSRGLFLPKAVASLRASVHGGEFLYARQVLSLVILELWLRMAVDRRGVL